LHVARALADKLISDNEPFMTNLRIKFVVEIDGRHQFPIDVLPLIKPRILFPGVQISVRISEAAHLKHSNRTAHALNTIFGNDMGTPFKKWARYSTDKEEILQRRNRLLLVDCQAVKVRYGSNFASVAMVVKKTRPKAWIRVAEEHIEFVQMPLFEDHLGWFSSPGIIFRDFTVEGEERHYIDW
jgi:hypothetical protein